MPRPRPYRLVPRAGSPAGRGETLGPRLRTWAPPSFPDDGLAIGSHPHPSSAAGGSCLEPDQAGPPLQPP